MALHQSAGFTHLVSAPGWRAFFYLAEVNGDPFLAEVVPIIGWAVIDGELDLVFWHEDKVRTFRDLCSEESDEIILTVIAPEQQAAGWESEYEARARRIFESRKKKKRTTSEAAA